MHTVNMTFSPYLHIECQNLTLGLSELRLDRYLTEQRDYKV